MQKLNKAWFQDAAERIVATFLLASTTALITSGVVNVDTAKAAASVGMMTALTTIKTIAAAFVGDTGTASLLKSPPAGG